MANQINIDIGAAANDGTGDPLRTAFNYVNLNFANVWDTGLPNSNVQFNNNRILTVNTNANLVLAPNGTGVVQSNVSIVPNIDRVHNLGSVSRKWDSIYAHYLNIDSVDIDADLTVSGNLTVIGNTIQIGNIVTDTKTIQLANTAGTANAANGSGITVGANDNIATLLYNSSSNIWTTNIGISAVGNVTAPYFIGNGALLTGVSSYSNANVAAYLPVYSGNISAAYINVANNVNVINDVVAKRGTFTGDPVTGDASLYIGSPTFTNLGTDVMAQFTGNVPNYAQINLQNYGNSNTASGDYIITADNGNDTTHFLDLGLTGSNWDGTQPNSLGNRLGPNDGYLYVQDGDFVLGTSNGTIETWKFDQTGNLTVPGDVLPVANNVQSLGSAANQWKDLWVSNNTIYINSVPLSLNSDNQLTVGGNVVSGGGGIVFEYDIANFTANASPAVGTMQFTNRLGEVVLPDVGTRLFINATDGTGINTGSTWLAMSQNSERGTLTLQQDGAQTPYRVTNIGVYNTPEVYRGYRAGVNQIWGDDPSINQIIISNAASPVFYNPDFDIDDDIFHATNLADATAVYMVNVYGSDDFTPLSQLDLWSFFTSFVDNVIYQGTDTETLDVAQIRNAFYTNFGNFYGSINSTKYDSEFRFASGTTYYSNAEATGGSGEGAELRVRLNANNTYTIMGISAPGSEYAADDTITIPGNTLNGDTPANDLVVTVNTVNGSGGITGVTLVSGVARFPWRSNSISDGGDDQYDTGNYINTNLAQEILYQGGNVTAGTTQFGADSEYAVMYNNSIFCMAATDVDITDLYYSGNLGADSDGFLRWSGLRNPNSVIAVEYAYMQCEQGTGSLEPLPGETYQVGLYSGGINLDQFYSYYNDAVNNWYFGADRDWILESKQTLDVQSYNTLTLQTLIPNEPTGLGSPEIIIRTDTGSQGNGQVNLQAGSGGQISIRAGDAGGNDNVPTLGNNGGPISIIAGDATGNGFAGGGVLVAAGQGAAGTAGNVTLRTRSGATANGAVVIETNNLDAQKFWNFDATGNLNLPVNGNIVSADNENARFQATDNGLVRSSITLDPNDGIVRLESYSSQSNQGFTTADWATGVFTNESGFGSISFTDAPNIINFLNTIDQSRLFFQVNSGVEMRSDGWSQGGNNITFYTFIPPASSPETVTDFSISYSDRSFIEMDYDEGELNIQARDLNVNIRSDLDVDILAEDVIRLENNSVNNPIYIVTDAANTNQTWAFTSTGALVLPGDANIAGGNLNGGTASASVGLNAFSPDGNTVSIRAQGNTSSAVISIFAHDDSVTNNWVFGHAPLDPTEPYFYVPGGALITTPNATGNIDGKAIFIEAGSADQSDFYTSAGGDLYLKGGRGATNDGGGGGRGGDVNINAGESADPAGVAGNVFITAGALRNWTFDNTGNLSLPLSGNIVGLTPNNNGHLSWFGNSSGDNNGYTTLRLVPDDTRESADQYLIIDPTAPGHIHIRAGGTQDNSGADLILGGENSYVKVTAGSNPPVYVSANSNVWTFTTDGVFQAPGDISASGNVTADNFIGNIQLVGNVQGTQSNVDLVAGSYTWSFNNTGNLVLPGNTFAVNYANGTPVSLGGGSSYGDSNVVTLLSSFGSNTVSTTGNITAGNLRTNNNLTFTANTSNIVFNNTAYISGNGASVGRDGSIVLQPYTGAGSTFPGVVIGGAGRLLAPSGSVHQVFNASDVSFQVVTKVITGTVSTSTTTGALQISGGAGFTGNIYAGGLANITGNINGGNLTTVGQVSATGTITSNGATNSTGFAVGNGAVNNCAIAMTPAVGTAGNYAIRDYSTANSIMFFDTTIGSANIGGSFQFRGSNAYTTYANINQYGVSQPTLPAFRVIGNGVTSVSTTTNGTGVLNGNNWATDYNQGSYLNSTTGTFTAPVAGLYQVNLNARVANNTGSSSQAIVYKNYGSANTAQVMWETAANCTVNHFGVSTVSKLAAGDTLSLVVTLGQLTFDSNDSWSVAFLG